MLFLGDVQDCFYAKPTFLEFRKRFLTHFPTCVWEFHVFLQNFCKIFKILLNLDIQFLEMPVFCHSDDDCLPCVPCYIQYIGNFPCHSLAEGTQTGRFLLNSGPLLPSTGLWSYFQYTKTFSLIYQSQSFPKSIWTLLFNCTFLRKWKTEAKQLLH